MYTRVNILPELLAEAEKFVIDNDRMLYRAFFAAAEQFCAENKITIGGNVGARMILAEPYNHSSLTWDLFCDDAYAVSKRLADALHDVKTHHVSSDTVAMQTNIKYIEFTISINSRTLFRVYGIKNTPVISARGYFTDTMLPCMHPIMQLVEIYRSLYSPAKNAEWAELFEKERALFDLLAAEAAPVKPLHKLADICRVKLPEKIKGVLVGNNAANILLNADYAPDMVTILTDENPQTITRVIKQLTGLPVMYKKVKIWIPLDFQITVRDFYADHTRVARIYNSPAYELIPHKKGVANPWVILRFMAINQCERGNKTTTPVMRAMRDMIYGNIPAAFQLRSYMGIYTDDRVVKRNMIRATGMRFPVYYPVKMKAKKVDGAYALLGEGGSTLH